MEYFRYLVRLRSLDTTDFVMTDLMLRYKDHKCERDRPKMLGITLLGHEINKKNEHSDKGTTIMCVSVPYFHVPEKSSENLEEDDSFQSEYTNFHSQPLYRRASIFLLTMFLLIFNCNFWMRSWNESSDNRTSEDLVTS